MTSSNQFRLAVGVIAALLLGPCGAAAQAPVAATVIARFELPATSLSVLGAQPFNANDVARARTNGLKYDVLPSLGSGLARCDDHSFVGISDRGPNGEVGQRRTFPLPKFAPHLTRFKLRAGQIEIIESIVLKDAAGKPLSGLSNQAPEERLFETADARAPLPYDPNGVDPEAVRVFPDGTFLLSEEYGPSVLVVKADGQVLVRYVPANRPLPGATYPVQAILPPVLAQRRTNRGFEALALAPDGRTAYVLLQSPLGDEKKFGAARVSRALRLDLSDRLNARVTGHFLMPLSAATNYGAALKQTGLKLNDAEWLAPDRLLLLEQAGETARLLVADFRAAGDLGKMLTEDTLQSEAAGDDFAKLPVAPAVVECWSIVSGLTKEPTKLEGLAIVSPTEIALANDNDFGLGEGTMPSPSTVWLLRLPRPLPLAR